eukprot:Sdes_comp23212_c0_seq1m21503
MVAGMRSPGSFSDEDQRGTSIRDKFQRERSRSVDSREEHKHRRPSRERHYPRRDSRYEDAFGRNLFRGRVSDSYEPNPSSSFEASRRRRSSFGETEYANSRESHRASMRGEPFRRRYDSGDRSGRGGRYMESSYGGGAASTAGNYESRNQPHSGQNGGMKRRYEGMERPSMNERLGKRVRNYENQSFIPRNHHHASYSSPLNPPDFYIRGNSTRTPPPECLLSLKQFLGKILRDVDETEALVMYSSYKQEFIKKHLTAFFDEYHSIEYMTELYGPEESRQSFQASMEKITKLRCRIFNFCLKQGLCEGLSCDNKGENEIV